MPLPYLSSGLTANQRSCFDSAVCRVLGHHRSTQLKVPRGADDEAALTEDIIAGEMTGRSIHAIELNPDCVDLAIKRWQDFTAKAATLKGDGRTFNEIAGIVSSDDPASTVSIAEPNHP